MALSPKQVYDRERYMRIRAKQLESRPEDPIELLAAETIAYISGLIDGEGSIFVAAVGPHRDKTVYPIVCVAMTNKPVIQWLSKTLAAGSVQLHNQTNIRRDPRLKKQWHTQLFGKRAALLCKRMAPYLIVKSQQARMVASFPTDARIAPGHKIERSAINELRYRLRDQINALNH